MLDERERYWIAYYNSYKNGYNEDDGGKQPTSTKCDRPIEAYDLEGHFVKVYPSISAAARELECEASLISAVIQKRRPTAKGYQFKAVDDVETVIGPFVKKKSGPSGKIVL